MQEFPSKPTNTDAFNALQWQMKFLNDFLPRMMNQCFRKCISTISEAELTKGEGTCTNRCVRKYIIAQNRVAYQLSSSMDFLEYEKALKAHNLIPKSRYQR